MSTQAAGRLGEDLALAYLKKKRCRLLERNWRFGHREIDLIVKDGKTIVFVEVKARTPHDFGTPAMAVNAKKQHLLITAAQAYLMYHDMADAPARFDVIEVTLPEGSVNHIPNAFGISGS